MAPSCLPLTFLLLSLFSFSIHANRCSDNFLQEALIRNNITSCKRYEHSSGVEFAWKLLDNNTQTLQVMVGARLEDETGWLAWGINFGSQPRMVGTQALIGIKQKNGTFIGDKYNVTAYIKIGCMLLPSAIDLNVSKLVFSFVHNQYHIIEATIHLPETVNTSRINHVWQVGKMAAGMEPKMHAKTLRNYDGTETIDLQSGKALTIRAIRRHEARIAHGVLNIIGWGIVLPIGVLIARYFRRRPIQWNNHDQWKYAHATCQTCGYVIGGFGWGVGLWLGSASPYYSFPKHGTYGIFIFTFATLQALALRLKPRKSDMLHKYWSIYHHSLGYALLAVICVNIFKGIKILGEGQWKAAYIAIIASLGFVFFVFEIVNWVQFAVLRKKEKIAFDEPKAQDKIASSGAKTQVTTP